MASIRKDILIDAHPDDVWDAVRAVDAPHRRLARGFVVDAEMDGDARVVTFANGLVARELIVDIDDATRRLAYASVGGRLAHHHATMQVFGDDGGRARLVWITDLLPDSLAAQVDELIERGAMAITRTLERPPAGTPRARSRTEPSTPTPASPATGATA